jgi:hypothetical protein
MYASFSRMDDTKRNGGNDSSDPTVDAVACAEIGWPSHRRSPSTNNVVYKRATRTSERCTPPNLSTSADVYLNNVIK